MAQIVMINADFSWLIRVDHNHLSVCLSVCLSVFLSFLPESPSYFGQ